MGKISVRKRGQYYEYRVEIAKIDDKRKWISKSGFNTKNEAYEAGTYALNEYMCAGNPFKSCNMSYNDYLDYWLKNYCETNLKYNTIQAYKVLIRKYIKPKIGHYKLSTITSVSLNNFITNLVNEYTLSKSYFKNILKVVKGSFRDACNIYGFIKYNPALTIRLPKINQESDIDLENGIINIEHSVYDKPKDELGRWFLGTTKTESGKRKISICSTLKQALINYKSRQDTLKKLYGNQYRYYHIEDVLNEYGKVVEKRIVINKQSEKNLDLIFTQDNGTYSGTDVTKYPYKIIKNELKIKCRFYDLRGSYATKILNNGIEIRDIADLLGHRNIETTENYYISSTLESKLKAIDSAEKVINSDIIDSIIKYDMVEN